VDSNSNTTFVAGIGLGAVDVVILEMFGVDDTLRTWVTLLPSESCAGKNSESDV